MERGINNGIRDKFGNEWRKGPSRTLGEATELSQASTLLDHTEQFVPRTNAPQPLNYPKPKATS